MRNNKGLLAVIAVILFGIFAVIAFEAAEDSPAENISEGVNEMAEDIGDSVE